MPERIGRWGEGVHNYPPMKTATIDGDSAGDLTVSGIKPTDTLVAVQDVAAADANLVDEFTISAVDTINNDDGTDTTGMVLLIIWYSAAAGV